ncbi:hypothetical protein C7H85_04280 [Zobellella endophytica]|uniref:Glycosyl transferase family 1 n=1 Tax=Zobellella endophytica TaxID=2116700 RepID=A0A2P7RCV0_9GAMM|nr:glycosyltransferase [Zobellella endophytica]PSJ48023.1 hypothetical protein C7H85_04280 [Zobellella endophytica]
MDQLIEHAIKLASQPAAPLHLPIKNRIAYVVSHGQSYASNGYAIRTQGVAKALNEHGFDTLCFVRPGRPWELGVEKGSIEPHVVVDGVRYIHGRWPQDKQPSNEQQHFEQSVQHFVELFRIYRPKAVLAASNYIVGLPAWVAATRLGLPFYNEVRGFWELSRDAREPGYANTLAFMAEAERDTFVAKQALKVFTLNQPMVDELVKRGVDLHKISIVPNGLSKHPLVKPADPILKAKLGIKDNEKVIGYIGSFNTYEGLDTLLEACELLVHKGEKLKLLIVGDEQLMIKAHGNKKSLADKPWLIQVGRVPHDQVVDYYALIDTAVLPRKKLPVCELVPPLKAAEALAYGKPLMVSDVASLEEYTTKHKSVTSFKAGSVDNLAKAIQQLMSSPSPKATMSVLMQDHTQSMSDALRCKGNIPAISTQGKEPLLETKKSTSEIRHEKFNNGVNRSSPILKIFLDSSSLPTKELTALIKIYSKISSTVSRISLVIYGDSFNNELLNDNDTLESILFETDKKVIHNSSFDIQIKSHKAIDIGAKFILDASNFKGFCESISKLYEESLKSKLLYFVYTTDNNIEAGYHRRSLHLKKSFSKIGVTLPLISYHSSSFKHKENISFIPKDEVLLKRVVEWLNPKIVIAASNYENAKPILNLKDAVDFDFIYEMRGLWHETYAAKMLEINNKYKIENDKNYNKGMNGELEIVRKADKVIFICKEMKDYIQHRIPEKEIHCEIIGNGYEITESNSHAFEVKKYEKENSEPFVIGYFGSITYYEGINLLLDAVSELIAEGLNVKVLLIGKNSITHKHVLDVDKYSFVQYEKFKQDISPYYSQINLFVVPRLPYEVCHSVEPLKPFDCFAKKIPLLLSDCKALNRLAGEGDRCLTFKAGDKVSLKEKIKNIIKEGYPAEKLDIAWNWVNQSLKWVDIAEKYTNFIHKKNKKIYYLYADKWWISYSWSGASINAINEMAVLSKDNDVYYNDIYVNDLFQNGIFNEKQYLERYSKEAKLKKHLESVHLPKVFVPSRDYDATFYRSGSNERCVDFFQKELFQPKIFSHNFVKPIWENSIIGFQTEASQEFAINGSLSDYDDDGTLGYAECESTPKRSFLRYQVSANKASEPRLIFNTDKRSRLKRELNSDFIIGVIGTIYDGTYPDLLFETVEKLRENHPYLNAKVVIYSINILIELPKKDWIVVSKYEKGNQEDSLLQLDVIVNTWKSSAQIYSGSNKNIDAINHGIPLIAARTPSYVEQLGEGYPLFYDFDPSNENQAETTKNSLEDLLVKCISASFRSQVAKYLIWRRRFLSIDSTSWLYNKQLSRIEKKKILLVSQNFNVGGVQKYSSQLIKSLADFSITILSAEKISKAKIKELRQLSDNIRIEYFKDGKAFIYEKFDLAFINSYPVEEENLLSLLKTLKRDGTKIYPIVHSDIHPFTVEISKHLIYIQCLITINTRIIEKINANTEFDFSSRYYHVTPVLEPIDSNSEKYKPKVKRSKKVAFFGRVAPLKCADFLARSFARYVKETSSEYQLLICGPVAQKGLDIIVNKANEYAGRKVIDLQNKSFNEGEREVLFKEVDALIYTTATEGLPYTFLEANELGTPVISSNVGAITHLIDDGVNGLLFNFQDLYLSNLYEDKPYNKLSQVMKDNEEVNYQEFKKVMLRFEGNDEEFFKMSANAISRVEKDFTFDVMRKTLRSIIY